VTVVNVLVRNGTDIINLWQLSHNLWKPFDDLHVELQILEIFSRLFQDNYYNVYITHSLRGTFQGHRAAVLGSDTTKRNLSNMNIDVLIDLITV